jgi:hypothetical protein
VNIHENVLRVAVLAAEQKVEKRRVQDLLDIQ